MATYTREFFANHGRNGAKVRNKKYKGRMGDVIRRGWKTRRERAALKARGNGA